jgi:mRNA interferase RelE/StbE
MSREYAVELTRTAEKELKRLHPRVRRQVRKRLLELETNPRPQDVKRLRGTERVHRIDSGDYRILYEVDDSSKMIEVWRIAHRKDVYRNL